MLILIDGNAMGHAHHNATKLSVGTFETQAVYGYARMLRDLLTKHGHNAGVIVLWDGHAQFRFEAFEGYKGKRNEALKADPKKQAHRDAYNAQKPFIYKAIELLGIGQMRHKHLEADDLAGYFVRKNEGKEILLVTGDGDWKQLVRPGVTWFDPRGEGRWVTHDAFHESTGYFTPYEFLQGKALMGDTSDSIPGVGGIGEKGAPEFLAQFKTVENFFAKVDAGEFTPTKKAHKNLASPEGRAAFERNMKLMNLLDAPVPDRENSIITKAWFDEAKFRLLCDRFAFQSITSQWDDWISPFKLRNAAREAMPLAA